MADTENNENSSLDELKAVLTGLLENEEKVNAILNAAQAEGLRDLDGAGFLTAEDWIEYKVPKVQARQLVAKLKAIATEAAAKEGAKAVTGFASASLLPQVPNDDDFLQQLRVGGVAKMDTQDVMAAVRAAYAKQYGIFDVDDKLLDAIAKRAIEQEEPYPELYYELERFKTKKAYADILKALGVPGKVVSEKAKKIFLSQMHELWPVFANFQERLDGWQKNWMALVANPANLLATLGAAMSGLLTVFIIYQDDEFTFF